MFNRCRIGISFLLEQGHRIFNFIIIISTIKRYDCLFFFLLILFYFCYRSENCYRCMAIHSKHITVLQYKESELFLFYYLSAIYYTNCYTFIAYCDGSLQDLCIKISGDAPLYSMFRKHPEAKPVPCPFKSAPFTFSYNKGPGDDCAFPPSKAESCTDDSRLVLKYQACPDIPNTESSGKYIFTVSCEHPQIIIHIWGLQ